jgi:ubiquinone/menaquinone biosynthesis C-methylase UbiE
VLVVDKLKATLDHPLLFNLVQLAISGRQLTTRRLLRRSLRLQPGEPLLDVCCGTGTFADVARGPYLGIDLNGEYIDYARRKYGAGSGHPQREFVAADITHAAFAEGERRFPKAMMVNSMHHLTAEENDRVLAAVAQVTTDRFVIVDMDPTPGNPVSRFLAGQDRGAYIRPLREQIALAARHFRVEQAGTFYDGLCGQTIVVCTVPRRKGERND